MSGRLLRKQERVGIGSSRGEGGLELICGARE